MCIRDSYYGKYTRLQHDTLDAAGVRSYFFLQPNQYAEGSKTFSPEERSNALGYGQAEELSRRYRRLREEVARLRTAGLRAFDLTLAFSDVAETVYIDNCCHVNELGNRVIADRIADAIIAEETGRQ